MDLLVRPHHLVKVLMDLPILPGHDPPEDCLRDVSRLVRVEHFKALQQQLGRIGRRFMFSVKREKLVEGDAVVSLVHGHFLGSPDGGLLVVLEEDGLFDVEAMSVVELTWLSQGPENSDELLQREDTVLVFRNHQIQFTEIEFRNIDKVRLVFKPYL